MKSIDDLIKEFQNLRLAEYPIEKIKEIFLEIGKIGSIIIPLHEGKIIYRARLTKENEFFSKSSDLSFLPADKNIKYQRASTPNNTMFYGSLLPEIIVPGELDEPRAVGIFECIPFLRDSSLDGEHKITFGKWRVMNDIPLFTIIQHSDFKNKTEFVREINEAYDNFISKISEKKEETIKIMEYLASEFAKKDTDNEYDYLVSSIFAERVIKNGLAGVLYPSVRTDGVGYSVAIHPKYVKSSMKLSAVGVCTVYKKGKKTIVDNESVAFLKGGDETFCLLPVESKFHMGRDKALLEINRKF